METVESLLQDYRAGFDAAVPSGVPTYEAMINGESPSSYRTGWTRPMAGSAQQRSWANSNSPIKIAEKWASSGWDFADGAPKPTPVLRITPEV